MTRIAPRPAPYGLRAKIHVMPKPGVLDPQGKAISHALTGLGFQGVVDARHGRYIELRITETNHARATLAVRQMCEKLLVNIAIENYTIELVPDATGVITVLPGPPPGVAPPIPRPPSPPGESPPNPGAVHVDAPMKFADTLSTGKPYHDWALSVRGRLGEVFKTPITLIDDQKSQKATMVVPFAEGGLIVTIVALSTTQSQATVFTTSDSPENSARVVRTIAEIENASQNN